MGLILGNKRGEWKNERRSVRLVLTAKVGGKRCEDRRAMTPRFVELVLGHILTIISPLRRFLGDGS